MTTRDVRRRRVKQIACMPAWMERNGGGGGRIGTARVSGSECLPNRAGDKEEEE